MSNQQPEQRASATSASATQCTTLSSKPPWMQSPALIQVQLTIRDLPLSAEELMSWRLFWMVPYGLLGRWTEHTTYKLIAPENTLSGGPWNNSAPTLTLGSDKAFETQEAAERETHAALVILQSLGFVEVERPGTSSIAMRWGYPDRQWLSKTMPHLVKELGINWDNVGIPDIRWLEYIQWEQCVSRVPEAT